MASIIERIRTKVKKDDSALQKQKNDISNAGDVTRLSEYDVYKIINNVRDTNNNFKDRYLEYELMAEDDVIGSALEMFADDATQIDTDTSRRVTIIADNKSLRKDIEAFLDSLEVEDRLWDWAYQVSEYGDLYSRVITDKQGSILYLEDVDNPWEILDLHYRGVRVNFAREVPQEERSTKSTNNSVEYEFYKPDAFIHFMIRSTAKSDEFYVEVNQDKSGNEPDIRKYKVIRGASMIEKTRTSFRVIRLLEDSLLAARIAKAEYTRVYNVEVGENTSPTESRKAIRRVKNLFDSNPQIDIRKGTYMANKRLRPIGDPVFNPVRGGKGTISTEAIGGDFEVKSLVDIEYFNNKLFSTLKIPKALLGFDEQLPGGLGDTTLMMQDLRYARSVKKVSQALISGLTQLINMWLRSTNRESDIGKFSISLTSPSSSEELMRLKELELRVETAERLLGLSRDFQDYLDLPELSNKVLQLIANYPELNDVMSESYAKASERWKKSNDNNSESIEDNY